MEFIFGRLTWAALPHEWFTMGGSATMLLVVIGFVLFVTKKKKWKWLWNEWLTSVDPKKIGIMYAIVASIMLLRGALDAGMIWLQQAMAAGGPGYLSAEHFQSLFTAHGVIMVFFVTMGFLFALLNYILPLQIGARDLASPFLNTLGFWLYVAGAMLNNMFFMLGGEFAATGWLAIAPLSGPEFSPGVGVDYWIWSLQVSGLGTLFGGINFIMTIIKMRAPGMTLMRMPLFTWTSLYSMLLVVTVFPVLSITIMLLTLDRVMGMHFFTTSAGGNAMMYTNLIWMWGHPEVYILILPAFGIYSEVVSTFSQKRIAAYKSAVVAAFGVSSIALVVWLHHFFTMGGGANVNAFFGISTAFIAIPTGVLIINWAATMYKGKIRFFTPMFWFLGYIATFTIGGMAGVLLATPPADFQLHNSLFLVAHFHTMAVGGALFGIFAAITYWFPKIMGFRLNEKIGKVAFWLWITGFTVSFAPLYTLGLMGATRRLDNYTDPTWQPFFMISFLGFLIISSGAITQIIQIIVSYRQRKQNMDTTGDPWNGRTLEWATSSPPPFYNFAIIPKVTSLDAFWEMKKKGLPDRSKIKYEDIEMPKNTALGLYISAFAFVFGLAMVWHVFWLAFIMFVGGIVCVVIRTFDEHKEYIVPASKVAEIERRLHSHGK